MQNDSNKQQLVGGDWRRVYAGVAHLPFYKAQISDAFSQESRYLRRVADRERYGYAWMCLFEFVQVTRQPVVPDGLARSDMDRSTAQSGKVSQYMLSGFRPSEHGFRFCKKRMARACQYDASADAVK
jgi:hypothetical protein